MKQSVHLSLIILLVLTSCEGVNEIKGVVLNFNDRRPIDSVQIIYKSKHSSLKTQIDTIYSDSNGCFQIGELIMCVPKCPDIEIIFTKKNFQTYKKIFKGKIIRDTLKILMKELKE